MTWLAEHLRKILPEVVAESAASLCSESPKSSGFRKFQESLGRAVLWIFATGSILGFCYFTYDRGQFWTHAVPTQARVSHLRAENGWCRSGDSGYSCTRYFAFMEFQTMRGDSVLVEMPAGVARGPDQVLTFATAQHRSQPSLRGLRDV
jgi:hypothetical protein